MTQVMDVERHQNQYNLLQRDGGDADDDNDASSVGESEEDETPTHKAMAAVDLLREDPKTKYLSPVNILFGLSIAFSMSVLNGEVIQQVLEDPNSTYVGLYTSVTSLVAAGASLLFGWLESTHSRVHTGKAMVLTIGASSYLAIALQFLAYPDGSNWNKITLLSIYTLLGIGRATFEGTLRALSADIFPNDKEGAFGNIILWSGSASTIGYVLSVTDALRCDETSRYCMQYHDGTTHNVLIMELIIIVTALIAIPSLWRVVWMYGKEQHEHSSNDVA